MSPRRSLALLLLLAVPLLFWNLGGRGLNEPDEGRCGSIARAMLDSGDWFTPRLYDRAHMDKPPLTYWAVATALRVGGVNEAMARLPAAAAALGTLLLVWYLAGRMGGPEAGLGAGLILATSPLFFVMGRITDPNMLLTCWTAVAMTAAYEWLERRRPWALPALYAALVLSFLTKGPIALFILLLALATYRFRLPSALPWKSPWRWTLGLVALALSLAWFLAQIAGHRELARFFLVGETFNRYFTEEHHRAQPFLFYVPILLGGMLPWLPLVLPGIARAWTRRRASASWRWLFAWMAGPFIMFSLGGSKLATYILPLLPAFAIAGGLAAREWESRPPSWRRRHVWSAALAWVLALGMTVYGFKHYQWSGPIRAEVLLWGLPSLAALGLSATRRLRIALPAAAVSIALVVHGVLGLASADELNFGSHTTAKGVAAAIRREGLRPDDRIVMLGVTPRGLSFYLGHRVGIPASKFEIQIESDRERLAGVLYREAAEVYRWFDREPRVFVVISAKELALMRAAVKRPIRELHRDGRFILIGNFNPES